MIPSLLDFWLAVWVAVCAGVLAAFVIAQRMWR